MAVYKTEWPGWSPLGGGARGYAGVAPPPHHFLPGFYNMVVQKPSPRENRTFLLDRSVFDLVDDHKFLSLTDPKLLGWYLCLSPEDRAIIQDEGGFQHFLLRHPALALSPYHVYVNCHASSGVCARPTVTFHGRRSVAQSTRSGAVECRSDAHGAHLDTERRPGNAGETLNPLGSSIWDGPRHYPHHHPHPSASSSITRAPTQQKASSHLNEERPAWPTSSSAAAAVWEDSAALTSFFLEPPRRGARPEMAAKQWPTSADGTSTEASLSQSDGPAIESDSSPEYYSCDGPTVDETEYSSVLEHVEENQPESSGERSDGLPGGMEHDDSVLFLLTSHDVKALKNGVRPDGGPSFATPATPRAATCDVMVGGDASRCTSAVTQTEGPETADKDVLTEVHMANLDALMKEFTKLNMVEEKLRWQTEELKSSTLRKECNCLHRAQRAELGLLALQYSMCRQHCWKLHCTSSEGGRLSPTPDSSNIESVLQKLEREYNAMREEIRAGVPLEQLEPLSVDPEKMTTRPRYVPAKIIRDVLGNVPSGSSQQQHKASGEEHDHRSSNGSQDNLKGIKMETGGARRAAPLAPQDGGATHNAPLAPQDGGATHNAHEPEEKRTAASPELGACEAWYDAEEDLHRAGAAREPTAGAEEEPREATSEEGQSAAVLRVSNLPSGVTESDVTLWSEEHRSSDVSISALENGLRVAMVTVSGPLSAETGVRELQGRPVQAEHVHRRASESSKEPGQPQSCGTEGKRTARPPLGSRVKNWKVVSVSPTAEGTFVPPHYGTMGSFDSLMAALTRRHPAAGRQSIVDALVELKAERGGVLSGLPLATIRDMASELLTRPANATRL